MARKLLSSELSSLNNRGKHSKSRICLVVLFLLKFLCNKMKLSFLKSISTHGILAVVELNLSVILKDTAALNDFKWLLVLTIRN